jgi:serine/threonine-protein kinase
MLRPKPQIVTTDLELNASPYAEVVSVTPEKGAAISLPPGDHWTPMRIDGVPAGTYSVLFRSGGTELTATCVVSSENHLCAPRQPGLSEDDISAIIGAGGGK